MVIRAKCSCGKVYKVADALAGQTAKCKACGRTIRIPRPDASPSAPSTPRQGTLRDLGGERRRLLGSRLGLIAAAASFVVVLGLVVGLWWSLGRRKPQRTRRPEATNQPINGVHSLTRSLSSVAGRTRGEGLGPSALVADREGKTLYVAEAAAWQVAAFDVAAGKVAAVYPLPGPPGGLALAPDGGRLYVSEASPAGKVHVIDLKSGKVAASLPVGHTPVALVLSPDGGTLYVCNRFTDDVSVVDLAAKRQVARVPVSREPVAAAITPDGSFVFIANHLPAGAADRDYVAAVVSVIETAERKVTAIRLPNGATGLRGVCVSPDGKHAYVTHILARYQLPTTQLERGWMNTNALSIIDAAERKLVNTVLLDDVDLGAANPWGVCCTPGGKYVCVAHAGTHEVSVIDRYALHEKLAKVEKGEKVSDATSSPDDVPNDLAFLVALRRRLKLAGNGPHGIALVGTKLYAAEYFTDTLGAVDIDPEVYPRATSLALGPNKPMSVARRGEMLFNDATMCFQQWQSCASCHPGGRTDGLNWDLLNDGFGNPKNTKSLFLSHRTPPVMITGVRPKAEVAVRAGIRFIQFTVRPEEDAAALDKYLNSLRPVASPHLVLSEGKAALSPAAARGREVFERAGCASCHPAPLYTDLKKYVVGTGTGSEKGRAFDTPALVEAWRTAPYLYDGRAATMKEVLTVHNRGDAHGVTSKLKKEEITDLAEFVLSQ